MQLFKLASNQPFLTGIPAVTIPVGPGPGPDDTYPNKPAGLSLLSPILTGDTLPDTSINATGWVRAGAITKVTDVTSPVDSTSVLQESYPPGSGNGASNGYAYPLDASNPQHWPQNPTEIYMSYWYLVASDFPSSLNANKMMYGQLGNDHGGPDVVGNKLVYLINSSADYRFSGALDASPVIFDPGAGTPRTVPMWPTIVVQGIISVDGVFQTTITLNQDWTGDPTQWKYQSRNVWHHHELWAKCNTPGNQDGSIRVWFDNKLVISYVNMIKWSNNPTQDTFFTMFWDPVYNLAVPGDAVNAYHHLKNLAVFGK